MKLVYTGPHDAVVVPLPGGGEATVERDGLLDTTDTHGAELLEQESNWQEAKRGKSKDTTAAPPSGEEG